MKKRKRKQNIRANEENFQVREHKRRPYKTDKLNHFSNATDITQQLSQDQKHILNLGF